MNDPWVAAEGEQWDGKDWVKVWCQPEPGLRACGIAHAKLVRTGEVCGFCYQHGHTFDDDYHPRVSLRGAAVKIGEAMG